MQALPAFFGVAGLAAQSLLKKPAQPAVPQQPNYNQAALAADQEDLLRTRRGVGANALTGVGGAEPPRAAGTKVLLGQ